MRSWLAPLFTLLHSPLKALGRLEEQAPYVKGAALALLMTVLYYDVITGGVSAFFNDPRVQAARQPRLLLLASLLINLTITRIAPILFLAAVFVPACLLAARLVGARLSFGILFRQAYAPLVSCILYSWAAAHLLMLLPAWLLVGISESIVPALGLLPLPYFVALALLSLHVTVRLSYGRAAAAVVLAGFSLMGLPLLPRLLYLLTSPFLLIIIILLLRNFLGDAISAQRQKESFRQNLEASTLNPADASAHYNLGLIYQQRGQYEEARHSFSRAIAIDPGEVDAHYQLGRIAREQGRLAEAVAHFDEVVKRDPAHSQNEIWREVGRAYYQAAQHEDARAAFDRFLEKRPSDAEGRYFYALTLHRLGRDDDAAAQMREVIEAVRTSPSYKYRAEKYWLNEAEAFLRSQSA